MTHNFIGFKTLIERECYRFARLSRQTIIPPVLNNLLFIFIFGFSLGSRIREIEGVPYIIFILPGLTTMGVIMNAYANTSTSLFMARMDRSLENMLASPLTPLHLVSAFIMGGLIRGLVIALISILIAVFIVQMPLMHPGWTLIVVILIAITFSSLGLFSALWAESWDHIATFTNFFITPFIYLGGVFYSIKILPPFWQKVSMFNPLFYMVDALRWTTLGHSDVGFEVSLIVLLALSIVSVGVTLELFRRGYKLIL